MRENIDRDGKYRQGSKIVSSTSIDLSAAVSSNRPDKKGVEKFTHRNQSVDRRARTPHAQHIGGLLVTRTGH